jgi:twitching motility protein PilI
MGMNSQNMSAFELLQGIQQKSILHALPLPQKSEIKKTFDGIGFSVSGLRFVAPLEQINEILTYTIITEVPGAKKWVKGIANVRGNLLAVSDFAGFVTGSVARYNQKSQILIVQFKDIQAGLIVDEVYGLRHFYEENFSPEHTMTEESFQKFVKGSYQQGNDIWPIIDIHSIVDLPEFRQVAN